MPVSELKKRLLLISFCSCVKGSKIYYTLLEVLIGTKDPSKPYFSGGYPQLFQPLPVHTGIMWSFVQFI